MNKSNYKIVGVTIGVVLLLCGGAFYSFLSFDRHLQASVIENQKRTRALYASLDVGMTKMGAISTIRAQGGFRIVKAHDHIWARSPLIFGSMNWHVFLGVDKNGRVNKVSVRDEDNPGLNPPGAPPDKTAS